MIKFNFKNQILIALSGTVLLLNACKKDKLPAIDPIPTATAGVYVLCEGAYGTTNTSTITYYNIASGVAEKDYFKKQNGIDLGTSASDLKQYGSKMYCVVTGSETINKDAYIEVINIATGKSIKRIPFFDANTDFYPRHIAFYKNKAYVTGYDGYVSRIDTANLTIEARIAVGGALEGITIVNDKLYAANSAHPHFVNSNNSSVSMVDISSFTKLKDIPVSYNPTKLAAANNGNIFVITSGSFQPFVASKFEVLSSVTNSNPITLDYSLSAISLLGSKGYVITNDYPAALKVVNVTTGVMGANFITDNTAIASIYDVSINPLDNNVFVSDATNYAGDGKVFCFGTDGKRKFDFPTGVVPLSVVFNYIYK